MRLLVRELSTRRRGGIRRPWTTTSTTCTGILSLLASSLLVVIHHPQPSTSFQVPLANHRTTTSTAGRLPFTTSTTTTSKRMASTSSTTTNTDHDVPTVSSRIQQTLDPCVVLMKELIGKYSHLWDDKGGIFSLAQGVVYWKPPASVNQALVDALTLDSSDDGNDQPLLHTYGPDEGLPQLRQAIQTKLEMENQLNQHDVMITVGANQAYTNCILTCCNQNDKVVVFAPYYFNHVMAIQMALPTDALVVGPCTDDGIPDLKWLEETLQKDPTIKMVTITNPGNPTGVALKRPLLQQAVDLCARHNAWLTLDCTYEYFINPPDSDNEEDYKLGGSFGQHEHVIHIFSFSKNYAMAGYRCGYVVVHKNSGVFEQMLKVQDTIPIAPSRIAQVAALAAMQSDGNDSGGGKQWVLEQFQTLETGRNAIIGALQTMKGQPIMGGSGAMYVMAKLPDKASDDRQIAELLVKDYGVAVIPGSFCGFPGWIRVCYSNLPPTKCLQAAERLQKGLQELCC